MGHLDNLETFFPKYFEPRLVLKSFLPKEHFGFNQRIVSNNNNISDLAQ